MRVRMALFAVILVLGMACFTYADNVGANFTTFNGIGTFNNFVLGWEFSVNSPNFTVTQLGALDLGRDGFQQPQAVGLWDSAGNLLASTQVTNADPLVGSAADAAGNVAGFRFAAITPVALTMGANYFVGAAGGEGYVWNAVDGFGPDLTFIEDRFHNNGNTSATLVFPESSEVGAGIAYFGGNLEYTSTVPEPSTCILLGTGLIALLGLARRRRRP